MGESERRGKVIEANGRGNISFSFLLCCFLIISIVPSTTVNGEVPQGLRWLPTFLTISAGRIDDSYN